MLMTLLLSIGIPVAYILMGAVYVRTESVRLYAKARRDSEVSFHDTDDRWHRQATREMYNGMRAWRFCFWPIAIYYDKTWPLAQRWFDSPIRKYGQETDRLQESLNFWQEQANDTTQDQESRELARNFVREYKSLINERFRTP